MIDNVESMVAERIKDWAKNNGWTLPKNIIYYRDGVSEPQYISVRDDELPQIISAFSRARQQLIKEHPGKSFSVSTPNLTAIVCAKRHHVRFYPTGKTLRDNCLPGTFVDDVITSPYYADFYLQSHCSIKGTARPAHYFVLRKDGDISIKDLRNFVSPHIPPLQHTADYTQTHELCFTYVRTSGPVSYASPAYYADRLCERGRCYLRDFFANTQTGRDHRSKLKKFKHQEEARLALVRSTKFGPLWNKNGTRRRKTSAETDMEDDHRKELVHACAQETMQMAKKEFYKNGDDRNPWSDDIAHTMFWM